jgi:hypothetical protein
VTFVNSLYPASVVERETIACFLAFQEFRFGPINTAKPTVEYLPSRQLAQSAYEKTLESVDEED